MTNPKKASTFWCFDGPDHGGRAQRLTKCHARNVARGRCSVKGRYTAKCRDCSSWGHSINKSKYCKATDKALVKEKHETDGISMDLGHIFFVERGWVAMTSAPHPIMFMKLSASSCVHSHFDHKVTSALNLSSSIQTVVCDTGCQLTAVPHASIYKVGPDTCCF